MAPSVECLPHKPKGLKSSPRMHVRGEEGMAQWCVLVVLMLRVERGWGIRRIHWPESHSKRSYEIKRKEEGRKHVCVCVCGQDAIVEHFRVPRANETAQLVKVLATKAPRT